MDLEGLGFGGLGLEEDGAVPRKQTATGRGAPPPSCDPKRFSLDWALNHKP